MKFNNTFETFYKNSKRILYGGLIMSSLIISCEKDSIGPEEDGCGIIEGVVKIDPSTYNMAKTFDSDVGVEISLLGESSTWRYLEEKDCYDVGNTGMQQASFSMGAYDGNEERGGLNAFKGVKPGIYSIKFYGGYFESSQGRIDLGERIVSTIGDTPIEVEAGRTTHIGSIVLTPE